MATFVITAEYVALNGTDISAWVRSATLELTGVDVDFTNMASAGHHEGKLGIKSGTLNIAFNEDFAASQIDSIIWGIWNTGTNPTFELRPTSAAPGAGNPKFTGSAVPTGYKPVGGAVGDAGMSSVSWPTSGAVVRATS